MNKAVFAVLTGDISSSSKADRKVLLPDLKAILKNIGDSQKISDISSNFELYRGDSFQGIIAQPEEALKYTLIIRTHLRKANTATEQDARIAIGIGTISFFSKSIAESDGEAFRNSGPLLDTMKNGIRIKAITPWEAVNEELEVALVLADAIISRWSASQAEVIEESLRGNTQVEIATKLGISQSAVNQRLKAANWESIEKLIKRFQQLVKKSTQNP